MAKWPPNNLRKLKESKGWSDKEAATALGYSEGGYRKVERSERKVPPKMLERAAEIYEVSKADILYEPPTADLVGYVGAGSEAHYYDIGQGPFDEVPMPSNGTSETVAVEIRGDSLGSVFNRWLVYYDDVKTPPTNDMLRKLCVVGLVDGRVLVKQLFKGSEDGLFHLVSQTEAMIENVEVLWAAVVKQMAQRK